MSGVPMKYAPKVMSASVALVEARRLGMTHQMMKDMIDNICDAQPLLK